MGGTIIIIRAEGVPPGKMIVGSEQESDEVANWRGGECLVLSGVGARASLPVLRDD